MDECEYRVLIIGNNQSRNQALATMLDATVEILPAKSLCASLRNWKQFIELKDIFAVIVEGNEKELLPLLEELSELRSDVPILLLREDTNPIDLSELPSKTVLGSIATPFDYAQILGLMQRVQVFHEQEKESKSVGSHRKMTLFHSLVGNSPAIIRVREMINQVANSDVNVLLLGPSGCGKEVVARNIHHHSVRKKASFIAINCGAIPADLLETELFGHEKGAFTGAFTARKGRFELANFGTLFLDEIGDMPLQMQVKLLRVLQEKCFERVGGNKRIEVNVRIIAATHRNLEHAIANGTFREDLYYRLNVFPIDIPPLKERIEDLSDLINDLIGKMSSEGRATIRLSTQALAALAHYEWPGNVRELANMIERLCVMYPGQEVSLTELPIKFRQGIKNYEQQNSLENTQSFVPAAINSLQPILPPQGIDLKNYLINIEKDFIQQALTRTEGVVSQAAKLLQLRRTTLIEKMRKYNLGRVTDHSALKQSNQLV